METLDNTDALACRLGVRINRVSLDSCLLLVAVAGLY